MRKAWRGPNNRAAGSGFEMRTVTAAATVIGVIWTWTPADAHHSFAMYDLRKTYVMTGVVIRVDPNPNHLQIFFAPLNDTRDQVVRDSKGQPVVWALEMDSAGVAAREGVTVNNFPRGTILSVGLHPHRNGSPAGGRGTSGLFKCPADTPPPRGKHCDSVKGATAHGPGVLPAPTGPAPVPRTQ
jgi:hypothetical protein